MFGAFTSVFFVRTFWKNRSESTNLEHLTPEGTLHLICVEIYFCIKDMRNSLI